MAQKQALSPHEAALILAFSTPEERLDLAALAEGGDIGVAQARSAIERLKMRGVALEHEQGVERTVSLTAKGLECVEKLLPELRQWDYLASEGAVSIAALQACGGLERSDGGSAFAALKKSGALRIDRGQVALAEGADDGELRAQQAFLNELRERGDLDLATLDEGRQSWLEAKRLKKLFKIKETRLKCYQLNAEGFALRDHAVVTRDEIGRLTPAMLKDESWKGRRFRPYNIGLPPRHLAGARNAYRGFLDRSKRALLGLGFEEMRGSLVENEFWNMDALFLPQFHPAREIHDVYFISDPTHAKQVPEPHLSQVAAAHEGQSKTGSRGWGYVFDRERTRRLVLRSQGTVLSARALSTRPKVPGKYFSMARCFRYDSVDATHAPDFFQVEGIVLGEDISFRHLLGMLEVFAREMAQAKEIKAVPAYFPFTEPSVEVHMKHPTLGWMELGGAGIFRPEVTESLGVDVPVIAWGLGLDRMAMMALQKDDIRHLFTNNLPHGLADNRSWENEQHADDHGQEG